MPRSGRSSLSRALSTVCAGAVVVGSVAWTGGGASAAAQESGPPYFEPVADIGGGPDIAAGPDGTVYVADGEQVSAVSRDGTLTAVPGTAAPGGANGVAVGADGMVYVAGGGAVRQVAPDGSVGWAAEIDSDLSSDSIAVDGGGTVYLGGRGVVVRIGPDGTTRTVGGGGQLDPIAAEGRSATEADLGSAPFGGVAVDAAGTVYFGVSGPDLPPNNAARLMRIDQDGTLHTVAGAGGEGFSGDGGPAVRAQVGNLVGAPAVAGDGDVYFFDLENVLVRKVGRDGVITSLAALPPVASDAALLHDLAVGPSGDLYASAGSVVYRLRHDGRSWTAGPAREPGYPARFPDAEAGTVHTVAGSGRPATGDGPPVRDVGKPATEVPLGGDNELWRMAVDHDGALLVTDSEGAFAVTGNGEFDQPFPVDDTIGYWWSRTGFGPTDAEAVAVGPDGSRFVAVDGVVYRVAPGKQPVPIAGHGEEPYDHDRIEEGRPATLSQFAGIYDLTVGPTGLLYVVTQRGVYRLDEDGTLARVFRRAHHTVQAVAVDAGDRVYVTAAKHDSVGPPVGHVYRIDPGAEPTVVAGRGESGVDTEDGAAATEVALDPPGDVAVADDGTLYLAMGDDGVLRVDTEGTVRTVVEGDTVYSLVLDRHGDLYFAAAERDRGQVKMVVRPGELSAPFPWVTAGLIAGGVVLLAAAGWFVLRRRRDSTDEPEIAE
jgi:hypothetical protein